MCLVCPFPSSPKDIANSFFNAGFKRCISPSKALTPCLQPIVEALPPHPQMSEAKLEEEKKWARSYR